jgi:hypothetical protein
MAEDIYALERKYPDWQVWTVPTAYQGTFWCARLHHDHTTVLNSARNPGELAEDIAAWYDEHPNCVRPGRSEGLPPPGQRHCT